MTLGADPTELARAVARRGWGLLGELSDPYLGGEGRRTWRVGRRHWLSAAHDEMALHREHGLLAELSAAFASPRCHLAIPEPLPTTDGLDVVSSGGLAWRVTRHLRGSQPDEDRIDTYVESGRGLRMVHDVLRSLPTTLAVQAPIVKETRRSVEVSLAEGWEAVTDDPAERSTVLEVATWLSPRLDQLGALPDQLIHGDWSTPNLLVSEHGRRRIVGVIDWQFAAAGPSIADLAQGVSTVLMWSSLSDTRGTIAALLDAYGDADAHLLGAAMASFWLLNYWRLRGQLVREPQLQPAMNRQPGRLRSVLAFARAWRGT